MAKTKLFDQKQVRQCLALRTNTLPNLKLGEACQSKLVTRFALDLAANQCRGLMALTDAGITPSVNPTTGEVDFARIGYYVAVPDEESRDKIKVFRHKKTGAVGEIDADLNVTTEWNIIDNHSLKSSVYACGKRKHKVIDCFKKRESGPWNTIQLSGDSVEWVGYIDSAKHTVTAQEKDAKKWSLDESKTDTYKKTVKESNASPIRRAKLKLAEKEEQREAQRAKPMSKAVAQ